MNITAVSLEIRTETLRLQSSWRMVILRGSFSHGILLYIPYTSVFKKNYTDNN